MTPKQYDWLLTTGPISLGANRIELASLPIRGALPVHLLGSSVGWRTLGSPEHRFLTFERDFAQLHRAVLDRAVQPCAAKPLNLASLKASHAQGFGQQLLVAFDATDDDRGGHMALVCVVRDILRTEILFAITTLVLGFERPLARIQLSEADFDS
ncbi:MAG TPA: hypothetical protein VKP30_11890 [Polyangiaceae bacterium]|nr:hypothetical protein [Polyangiaceae bacterium]